MAVPSSGTLSMLGLSKEKVHDNYSSGSGITNPISMYDLVNGGSTKGSGNSYDVTNLNSASFPNDVTPHAFSEWYSYDHDYAGSGWTESGFYSSCDQQTYGAPGATLNCNVFSSKANACAGTTDHGTCISVIWNGTLGNGTVLHYVYNSCANKDDYPVLNGGGGWLKMGNVNGQGCGSGTNDGPNNAVWGGVTYQDKVMQVSSTGVVSNYGGCNTSYSSSDMGVFLENCNFNGTLHTMNQTYYHDGSGTYPTAGDICYSDSAGTSVLAAGYYTIPPSSSGNGNRTYIRISTNQGVVDTGYPQTC